jgi:hypothetical protein
MERICSDDDEPRLQLIIKSQSEHDNEQFDRMLFTINNHI